MKNKPHVVLDINGGKAPCLVMAPDSAVTDDLVVIDLGDGSAMQRIARHLDRLWHHDCQSGTCSADVVRQAIKAARVPSEPEGLGAVVEDQEGRRWVHIAQLPDLAPWKCADGGAYAKYDDLDIRCVLSPGVDD